MGQMERGTRDLRGERPVPREGGAETWTYPWEIKSDFSPNN